jgi:hypothetical protein
MVEQTRVLRGLFFSLITAANSSLKVWLLMTRQEMKNIKGIWITSQSDPALTLSGGLRLLSSGEIILVFRIEVYGLCWMNEP